MSYKWYIELVMGNKLNFKHLTRITKFNNNIADEQNKQNKNYIFTHFNKIV